ncbi:hypothetical protein ACIOKD_41440 [Streptomyces sp. NPDC087844]|uniref:hypothetical protein n=1 Tax=Streptomyces sp. NPDC087844 TaxID=3365805 RepID=UPI0037F4D717
MRPEDSRPEAPEFFVIVTSAGTPFLDSRRVRVPSAGTVRSAVLDALHQHAQARNGPVRGRIEDRQEGYTVLLEVAPDGSSRLVKQAEAEPGTRPPEATVPIPPAPAQRAPAGPAPVAEVPAGPELPQAPADHAPVSLDPAVPSGEDAGKKTGDSQRVPVPQAFLDTVLRINRAIAAGELYTAVATSRELRRTAERDYGADHAYTLEAQGMGAYVAYLADDFEEALSLSLQLAQTRHRNRDPQAWEELGRAAQAWQAIDDGRPRLIHHGRTLLALWKELWQYGPPPETQAEVLNRVQEDIQRLIAKLLMPVRRTTP